MCMTFMWIIIGYDDMTWEPEYHLHCQQKLETFLNKITCSYNHKTEENMSCTTDDEKKPLPKKQKLVKLIKPRTTTKSRNNNNKPLVGNLSHNDNNHTNVC